jgi:hypothetical protein
MTMPRGERRPKNAWGPTLLQNARMVATDDGMSLLRLRASTIEEYMFANSSPAANVTASLTTNARAIGRSL